MSKLTSCFTVLGLCFGLAACEVGSTTPPDVPDPPITGDEQALAGEITTDLTLAGEIRLTEDATIAAGVTVTIAAGSVFTANQATTLRVHGALSVAGTPESRVSMTPAGALPWNGIVVEPGGQASLVHATGTNVATLLFCHQGAVSCTLERVEFDALTKALDTAAPSSIVASRLTNLSNGGVMLRGGGDLHVEDSYLLFSSHDLLISSGGRLTMDHSEIGATEGGYDHCAFHFGGATEVIVTNSNIVESIYGMMIGSVQSAVFDNNNFIGNDTDVADYQNNGTVDMTGNYWSGGAPALGGPFDTSNPLPAPVADAGPRI